jgi:uncharacterized membrane protein YdjX (TVP38/TMEM64 family)
MAEEQAPEQRNELDEQPRGIKRLIGFMVFAVAALVVTFCTPVGGYFGRERVGRLAEELGVWGPVLIIAVGTFSPLLFLPRAPLAFVSGLLYGITWGTALATFASTLGAWLNFWLAKTLLAPAADRLRRTSALARLNVPPDKEFLVIFILRAVPISNFVVTNLLAGALKMRQPSYLLATFLGMIPTSIMYAAWGKLLKEPSAAFAYVAAFTLLLVVGGTWYTKKYLLAWFRQWGTKPPPPPTEGNAPA